MDAGDPSVTLHSAMAKRFATDTCFGVANDALQLLGGYGCDLCGPGNSSSRLLGTHATVQRRHHGAQDNASEMWRV